MDYLKIAEIANRCEVKHQQIIEYYRFIGANLRISESALNSIHESIKQIEKDLKTLDNKLRKLVA